MIAAPRFELPDLAATQRLGARLADALAPGDMLLLQGDLGVGKTALAQAVIRRLAGEDIEAPSPTFILAAPYDLPSFPLLHVDLYRLSDAAEIEELGLAEALEDGVVLLEWPELLGAEAMAQSPLLRLSDDDAHRGARQAELLAPAAFMRRFDDAGA